MGNDLKKIVFISHKLEDMLKCIIQLKYELAKMYWYKKISSDMSDDKFQKEKRSWGLHNSWKKKMKKR